MTAAYCRDCMEAMREMPDEAFDLAVVDPPYGINITGRHRAMGNIPIVGGVEGPSAAVVAPGKHDRIHRNFITRSTIAPRRTSRFSGSCGGYRNT